MPIRKRPRTSIDTAVVDVYKRELGQLSSRNFANRLAASEDLVLRLDVLRKLDKHRGCVNTVSFNAAGDILVSGSDDTRIILWDWETGNVKLSFDSGHENNVFQAKIIPYTNDRTIVTCAADGKVRYAQILDSRVETKSLAEHSGRVHKLAVVPECPHTFYTCAEDGLVQHIDLRTGTATSLFSCKGKNGHSVVPLNAIALDPRNSNYFSVGGSDQFARVYDIRQYKWDGSSEFDRPVDFYCPPHLVDDEHVGITGLAFSAQSELLVSYNDEFIYLFTKDIGLGPDPNFTYPMSDDSDVDYTTPDRSSALPLSNGSENAKAYPQVYKGHRNSATVKGVNFFGPKCEYVVSGSDCGRIFIWKKKGGELIRVMEADRRIVNCIEPHPHSTMLASSGIESNIKIWIPKATDKATLPTNIQKARVHQLCDFYDYDDDSEDDFIYFDDDEDDDFDDGDNIDDDDVGSDYYDSSDYSWDDDDDDDDDDDSGNEDEDAEGDGKTEFSFLEAANDNIDFASSNIDDEVEEIENDGDIDNGASDDSLIDVYDDWGDCSTVYCGMMDDAKAETKGLDASNGFSRRPDAAAVFLCRGRGQVLRAVESIQMWEGTCCSFFSHLTPTVMMRRMIMMTARVLVTTVPIKPIGAAFTSM